VPHSTATSVDRTSFGKSPPDASFLIVSALLTLTILNPKQTLSAQITTAWSVRTRLRNVPKRSYVCENKD
jgi:hypothetical protein